jgi:SAM-dependent methyltransferase
MVYQPAATAAHFDAYGEREWTRLDATLPGRIKYAIHRRFLLDHIRAGMRVADLGCGPGRFAIDAIRLGARVTLVDLSPVQLDAARARIDEAGLGSAVDAAVQADVCDLSALADASFDLVLCYGGAVSYTRERHPEALREIVRIAKPGAPLLLSVMSLYGTLRLIGIFDALNFLDRPGRHVPWQALLDAPDVLDTVEGSDEFHLPMTLFSSNGLRAALDAAGASVLAFAAANPLTHFPQRLERIEADAEASQRLLDLEVAICDRPDIVDNGEHLVAVARKR